MIILIPQCLGSQLLTGQGSNFYSSCSKKFKLNALSTLLHRAITLTSTWKAFHTEIEFLHTYFRNNYFPSNIFFKYVERTLVNIFKPANKSPTVSKLPLYSVIPYINDKQFKIKLRQLISNHFGAVDLRLIPINPFKIGSFFKIKESLNYLMTSCVVYKYSCPRCKQGTYIGSTHRLLKVRIDSHKGVSYRTGSALANPEFSNIREHSKKCKSSIRYNNFEILGRAPNESSLAVLESLKIKQAVPSLNTQTTSTPLFLA